MPAKKKKVSRTKSTAPKAVSVKKSSSSSNSNSLLLLALGCGVLAGAYLLFSTNATAPSMPAEYPTPSTMPALENMVAVQLNEQNNSGEYGNATLKEVDGKVVVTVDVKNAPRGVSQPAHIHVGSCIAIGAVKYPLKNILNGMSETTLNVSMSELSAQGPLALNVHKSTTQSDVYVSCGNVQ